MLTAVSPQATHLHAGKRSLTIMKPWRRKKKKKKSAAFRTTRATHHLQRGTRLSVSPSPMPSIASSVSRKKMEIRKPKALKNHIKI
ncbi:hypothetical protein BHE74_00001423 [Ensete ventricosum]|nr:hypothetical protein BHE74_00001423 [Ensete ventricosum]